MGRYKDNPKEPYRITIPNKIRKRFKLAKHVTRMEAGGLSALGVAFTRIFYGGK